MRYLGLDIGQTRIGVAVSDAEGRLASPVKVMPAQEVLSNARTWRLLLDDYQPQCLVCGLPLSLDGQEHDQALRIRGQAEAIARAAGLPLEFADERLSSAEAKRILREEGLTEKAMRGKVDMVAASLILQAWLDAHAQGEAQ